MVTDRNDPVDALDDGELARRILASQGDHTREAEDELCRRYLRRLRLFGLRHLGSIDRAEDLAHDVLLIVLEKLRGGEVREPDRVGSFILGVARMRTKSTHRRSARDKPLDASTASLPSDGGELPDPIARERMVRCLESLSDQQRAVVVLTYYGEQSTGDIASSLGLSANNVRVSRHRGIASLRDCLGLAPNGTTT